MARDLDITQVLVNPDPNGYGVRVHGRAHVDCQCVSARDCSLTVSVDLPADNSGPARTFSAAAWVQETPVVSGYRKWNTFVSIPSDRPLCGRDLVVHVTGSDQAGACTTKDVPVRPNCCAKVDAIDATVGACAGPGNARVVTVTFKVLRKDLAGSLVPTVLLKRANDVIDYSKTLDAFEETEGAQKSYSTVINVSAPPEGQNFSYSLQVKLTPEGPDTCEKGPWSRVAPVIVNACDCTTIAGALTLENVTERDGHAGACVDALSVTVVAPDFPADPALQWINAQGISGTRKATVTLTEGGEVTVYAILGSTCSTVMPRVIRHCGSGTVVRVPGGRRDPIVVDPVRTRPWYCITLEGIAMVLLLVAIIAGFLALCVSVEGSMLAAYLIETGYGAAAVEVIVGYVTLYLFITFATALGVSLAALLLWWILCRPSDCRIWEDFAWVCAWALSLLTWFSAVCFVSLPILGMISLLYFAFARPYIKGHGCTEPDMLSLAWLRP